MYVHAFVVNKHILAAKPLAVTQQLLLDKLDMRDLQGILALGTAHYQGLSFATSRLKLAMAEAGGCWVAVPE